MSRVTREAFIAPDGTWYACCFDSNNQLVLWECLRNLGGRGRPG